MDPQRKRKIRLVVALGAAVLLAAALVYTSFTASTEAKQPSRAAHAPRRARRYDLTGKVVPGSIERAGSDLAFRGRRPRGHREHPGHLHAAPSPTPSATGARSSSPARSQDGHLRRRARHPGDQVPVEVHGGEEIHSLGSAALALAFLTALFAGRRGADRRRGDRRWVDSSRRAVYALCGLLTICVDRARGRHSPRDDFSFAARRRPLLDDDADLLQADRDVVEPGRLAAALGLGALDRLQRGPLRHPQPPPRDRPLRDRGADGDRRLLRRADAVRARRPPVHPALTGAGRGRRAQPAAAPPGR